MRYVKILGLAVVAAMAMAAFVGAGSASANWLCTENKSCPTEHGGEKTGKMLVPGDIIEATAVNPTLTASPEITCTHSVTKVKITKTGSKTENVTGEVTALTFTGCKADVIFNPSCTVTVENLPYHAEIIGSGASASLTVRARAGGGEPSAKVSCAGIINCTFGKTDFNLGITGGNPATVFASAEELEISEAGGFGCPEEAFWDADYKAIGTNTSVFVLPGE